MSNINNLKMNLQKSYDNNDYLKSLKIAESIIALYDKDDKTYEYLSDLYNLSFLQQKLFKYPLAIKGFKKILKLAGTSSYRSLKNTIRVPNDDVNNQDINMLKLIINSYNSLGICYSNNSSKSNIAMAFFERSLYFSSTFLSDKGYNHERLTCMSLYNIGCLHYDLEEYDEAIAIHERAKNLKLLIKEEDLDYVDILNYLSYSYEALGKMLQALGYAETSTHTLKNLYGVNSEEYISNLYNLCRLYDKNEQYELALKNYEKVCNLISQKLESENSNLIEAFIKLSDCNIKLENYDNAIKVQQQILTNIKDSVGETHIYYASNLKRTADIYYIIKDYEKALIYYIKENQIKKDLFGLYHREYILSLLNLINLYILTENSKEHELIINSLFNSIDYDMSKNLYNNTLLRLSKIYQHYNMTEELNKVYSYYKNTTSDTFDNMLKSASEINDEIIEKNELIKKNIYDDDDSNFLDIFENNSDNEENLSSSIKDFFDILRDEVESSAINNLFDNLENILLDNKNELEEFRNNIINEQEQEQYQDEDEDEDIQNL